MTDDCGVARGGGIARYNGNLLQALSLSPEVERLDVVARCAGPADGSGQLIGTSGATVVQSRGRGAWVRAALMRAATKAFDVVFCGHVHAVYFSSLLARVLRARLWLQVHGVEAWRQPSLLSGRAVAAAHLVTAVSRYTRERLLQWSDISPYRVRVLPCTYGSQFVPGPKVTAVSRQLGLQGRRTILSVSRLAAGERYKGHDRIIRLLPRLLNGVADVRYLVVGDGDDRTRLEALASDLGVAGKVVFAGAVSDEMLADYYRLADVYALPSTGEGFGITFLEAAACGVPVVGGSLDGSLDALADGAIGVTVDPHDDQALLNALCAALTAPQRANISLVARFAPSHFQSHVDALVRTHFAQ